MTRITAVLLQFLPMYVYRYIHILVTKEYKQSLLHVYLSFCPQNCILNRSWFA